MKHKNYVFAASIICLLTACNNEPGKETPKRTSDTVKSATSTTNGDVQRSFTDVNGKKQGHWIVTGGAMKCPGYTDDAKIEEGDYMNDKKQGLWVEYYPSGNIKRKVEYKDDSLVNVVASFSEKGKPETKNN